MDGRKLGNPPVSNNIIRLKPWDDQETLALLMMARFKLSPWKQIRVVLAIWITSSRNFPFHLICLVSKDLSCYDLYHTFILPLILNHMYQRASVSNPAHTRDHRGLSVQMSNHGKHFHSIILFLGCRHLHTLETTQVLAWVLHIHVSNARLQFWYWPHFVFSQQVTNLI